MAASPCLPSLLAFIAPARSHITQAAPRPGPGRGSRVAAATSGERGRGCSCRTCRRCVGVARGVGVVALNGDPPPCSQSPGLLYCHIVAYPYPSSYSLYFATVSQQKKASRRTPAPCRPYSYYSCELQPQPANSVRLPAAAAGARAHRRASRKRPAPYPPPTRHPRKDAVGVASAPRQNETRGWGGQCPSAKHAAGPLKGSKAPPQPLSGGVEPAGVVLDPAPRVGAPIRGVK